MVNSGSGEGAGGTTFDCLRIDTMMSQGLADRLDFLKMDVEGGEKFILAGAMATIRKHRPKLAVAIYHDPKHLWDYPCYLLDNLEDYRFYLRQYGYTRFETLLYAVPAEATITGSGAERLRNGPKTRRTTEAMPQPLVLAWFRDAKDSPRHIHPNGDKRVLTRLYGVDWETAELSPGPWIDVDEIIGVIETPDGALLFAQHEMTPGNLQVIGGVSPRPSEIHWFTLSGLVTGSRQLLVEPKDGVACILSFDPATSTVHVYEADLARMRRREAGAIRAAWSFLLEDAPVWARWSDGELHVACRVARRGLKGFAVSPGAPPRPQKLGLPAGDLAAAVAVKFNGVSVEWRPAVAIAGAGGIAIHARTPSGWLPVAQLAGDSRTSLLPTYAIPPDAP
jgi:hypothetical protein